MPIGAINDAGRQVFSIIRRLREELKVNTTCGASNIGFGLPARNGLNAAFDGMAIGAGMTSPMPIRCTKSSANRDGGAVMMGHDPECRRWISKHRERCGAKERAGRRGGRRRRVG